MITTNLASLLNRRRAPGPAAIVLIIFGVALIVALIGRVQWPARAVAVAPTPPLPILIVATRAPEPQPTPAAQIAVVEGANTLPRAVVAYSAPDGQVLGAIEAGRAYGVLASYGAAWLQLEVSGSGAIWVRAAELFGAPALADLAPPPAPEVVYVAQPAAPPTYAPESYAQPAYSAARVDPPLAPPPAAVDQGPGGSGKMDAPSFDPLPAVSGDDASRWCAAAAAGGHASCVVR